MKIEINDNKPIGTLCYSGDAAIKLRLYKDMVGILVEINNLAVYYYIDLNDNKTYIKLNGSITNMLRFRTSLKCCLNLIELKKWRIL